MFFTQVRSWGTPAIMLVAVANGALRGYLDTATPLIVAAIAFVVDYSVDPEIIYPQGTVSFYNFDELLYSIYSIGKVQVFCASLL